MARLSDKWGCVAFLVLLLGPGLFVAYFMHSAWWIILCPVVLVALMLVVAALPSKRKRTPQEWANELEKHLLGTEGPFDWDDAISVKLANQRLESLRQRILLSDFDRLDTPEKREQFRLIIDALRRGEVP